MDFKKLILPILLLGSVYNINALVGDIVRGTTRTAANVVEGTGEVAADIVDPRYRHYRHGYYYRDGYPYRRGYYVREPYYDYDYDEVEYID
ncbi:hypothetical protein M1446_01045 [Candidatus Dependentiae bacterium]|nr:hypothetical protein [Candidatus Dependentiae bacterium]